MEANSLFLGSRAVSLQLSQGKKCGLVSRLLLRSQPAAYQGHFEGISGGSWLNVLILKNDLDQNDSSKKVELALLN